MGVAHPTGFPLYLLVAKLVSFVPFGSVAFRVNLVSAIASAVAIGVTYRIVLRLAGRSGWPEHAAVAAAALVLGSSTTLWLHATTAEIYAFNLLATSVLVWWTIQFHADGQLRRVLGLAVLTGLGCGLHITFLMAAGICWLFVAKRLGTERRQADGFFPLRSVILSSLVLGLVAACVVLYLPLRASQQPWVNWGSITDFSGFWEHISGGRIRQAYGAEMAAFTQLDMNLTTALEQLFSQCSWGVILSGLGLLLLLRRLRAVAGLLAALWIVDVLFTVWLNPMGMADRQTGLSTTLYSIIFLGVATAYIGRWMADELREWGAGVAVFIAVVGLCSPAMLAEPQSRNLKNLYQAADLADMVFEQLPSDALLLTTSDDLAGTSLYAQGVEGQRPDVSMVVKQHVLDRNYLAHVDALGAGIHISDALLSTDWKDPNQALDRLAEDNESRTIFWELGDPILDDHVRLNLRLDLPVATYGTYRFRGYQHICVDIRRRWRRLSYGMLPESGRRMLARMYSTLSIHGLRLAKHFQRQGDKKPARDWTLFAANTSSSALHILDIDGFRSGKIACDRIESPDPAVLTNAAASMNQLADLFQGKDGPELNLKAERCFRRVADLRSGEVRSWLNLGKARFRLGAGQYSAARAAFDEARLLTQDDSQRAEIEYYESIMEANEGHLVRALNRLESVLSDLRGGQRKEAIRILAEIRRSLHPTKSAPATR